MSNRGIDDDIRQAFDAGEFEYNPASWEALSKRMDEPAVRKVLLWPLLSWKTGMAACIAALLLGFLLYPRLQPAEQASIAAVQPETSHTRAAPDVAATTIQDAAPVASVQEAAAPQTTKIQAQLRTPGKTAPAKNELPQTAIALQAKTDSTAGIAAQLPANQPVMNKTLANRTPTEQQVTDQHDIAFNHFPELPLSARQQEPSAALGVTGGYNRGNANSGFALGINASTRLAARLSLEGDIAYIRNNNPTSTSDMSDVQYKSMSNSFAAASSADAVERIDISTLSRISYLQFAPTLSYRLGKKLHLGLGADIQQMLPREENNDNVIYLKNYDMKILPRTDVGYTGKVNYSITSKLKAGLLYREGLQAALDSRYFNRRYVQFTFQYSLLQR